MLKRILTRLSDWLDGTYCNICGAKRIPHGYNYQLMCPNRCAWKLYMKGKK